MENTGKRRADIVVVSDAGPACSKPKRQTNLNSFFGGTPAASVKNKEVPLASSSTAASKRTLQPATAEKWKTTSLAKYDAENWLIVNINTDTKLVESLKCAVCTKFEGKISSVKGFNYQWSRDESTRLQHAAALEHVNGDPHKLAYDLFLKNKGLTTRERGDIIKQTLDKSQTAIAQGFAVSESKNFETSKKKFETAFFVVKEEIPIAKYKQILSLEEKHGVVIGAAYRNDTSAGIIIDYIADSLKVKLKKELEQINFYSILTDGSTDASTSEKEAMFVVTFDAKPPSTNKIKINISYLNIADITAADARGIIKAIENSFQSISYDNWLPKLVGFGSDGASVNRGKKEGVHALLRQENEWLTFGWCVAHRLELSLKDSLGKTSFADVDEMILRLYYIYKNLQRN